MNARLASLPLVLVLLGCGLEHPSMWGRDASGDVPSTDQPSPDDAPDAVATDDVIDAGSEPDAPDVVAMDDVIDAGSEPDAPDAVATDDVVDAGSEPDAPDVLAMDAPDVLAMDAPDVLAMDAPDVLAMDAPDVLAPDVVDVPAVTDRPDVVDVPPVDSGPPTFESCEAARLAGRPSGAYLVRAGATSPWLAYCDTSDTSGAWTLVLKADGRQPTFGYDQAIWSNTALLNEGSADLSRTEAKFLGFVVTPIRRIRVQMVTPADGAYSGARSIQLAGNGTVTLQQVFASNLYVDYSSVTTEEAWSSLVPDSRMQGRCNRRGLNVRANNPVSDRIRIGMIGNENVINECDTHDSRVGVGGAGAACGGNRASNTVGNAAGCVIAQPDRDLRAFAYVWVR